MWRNSSPVIWLYGLYWLMAERVGFEPTVPIARDTRFPGAPVRPLQHLSVLRNHGITLAERVGFEPTIPIRDTAFRERRLKPLGHLSGVAL